MKNFRNSFWLIKILFVLLISIVYQCKKPEPSADKVLSLLVVTADKDYTPSINETTVSFSEKVPYGTTEVTIKTIAFSENAKANKAVGDKLPTGTAVTIAITAEDNSTQNYTFTIPVNTTPPAPQIKPVVSMGDPMNITVSGATISGTLINIGSSNVTSHGYIWGTATNPTITGAGFSKNNLGNATTSGTTFSTTIGDLEEGTTYYVRAYASNSVGTGYSEIKNFKTLEPAGFGFVPAGGQVSVTLSGSGESLMVKALSMVSSLGSGGITQHGHVFSNTLQGDELKIGKTNTFATQLGVKTETGEFFSLLENLHTFTVYYVRPYIISPAGIVYGRGIDFMTPAGPPSLTIGNSNATLNSIAVSGAIVSVGDANATVNSYGHIWSTTSGNLTMALSTKSTYGPTNFTGAFGSLFSGFTKNTTYYLRSYAENGLGTGYSPIKSVKTLNDEANILSLGIRVSVPNGNDFTQLRSVADGTISGTTIFFTDLPWGTTQATVNEATFSDQATGVVGVNTLTGGTALNVGTNTATITASAGNTKEYTLSLVNELPVPPTLSTLSSESINPISETLRAQITDFGISPISGYGFIYSTSSGTSLTLTGSGTQIAVGTSIETQNFTKTLTNLVGATTYYYVAYAFNAGGVSYSTIRTFTTPDYILPTVTTLSATGVSVITAMIRGQITDAGNTPLSGYGFIYKASSGESLSLTLTGDGTQIVLGERIGTEVFSRSFTELTGATTFYFVAYATNAGGTTYGTQLNFTTDDYVLPTISSISATNITFTSAFVDSKLKNSGNTPLLSYGFKYYDVANSGTLLEIEGNNLNSDTGIFSNQIQGLTSNTTYYLNAFARNYGGETNRTTTFTTQAHTEKEITRLTVIADGEVFIADISGTDIRVKAPYGTTKVNVLRFDISPFATSEITEGSQINVGETEIVVRAQDGSTKTYTLTTSNLPFNSQKNILAMTISGSGTITGNVVTISGTVTGVRVVFDTILPKGTTQVWITHLTLSPNASANVGVGESLNNIVDGSKVIVTAADGTTKTYTIVLNVSAGGVRNPSKDITNQQLGAAIHIPGNRLEGIYTDGETMWVSVNQSRKAFAINMASRKGDPSKNIDIITPGGNVNSFGGLDLHSDGTTLWVAVQPWRRIYAYNMTTNTRDESKEINVAPNYPVGIWGNGTTMWVTGLNGKINAYNMNTGAKDTSKDININASSGDNQPASAWSDGTTMYSIIPTGHGHRVFNRKVAAYNLLTRNTDTAKDITIGLHEPTFKGAITSDGNTLYILGENWQSGPHIFAYDLKYTYQ